MWRAAVVRMVLAGSVATSLLTGILGCGSDTSAPVQRSPLQAYWSLGLNQHAVMLALQAGYDTVQLTVTPQNALGAPVQTTGTARFRALDTTVRVSPTGLVTAHAPTAVNRPVKVIVSLQDAAQQITHADTVLIAVTTTVPPAIDTFSIQPVVGDSAKRALDNPNNQVGFTWPVRAVDANGTTVCNTQHCTLLVYYQSSRPQVATINPTTGHVAEIDTGHVVFTAQTLAYHQVLRDSVNFQIGYMVNYTIVLILTAVLGVLTVIFGTTGSVPKKLILGVGAVVTFCNAGSGSSDLSKSNFHPIDIVFDHPEGVDSAGCGDPDDGFLPPTGSGNIAPFGGDTTGGTFVNPDNLACRRFPVAGVYHYHSTLFPSDTYEIDIQQDPR